MLKCYQGLKLYFPPIARVLFFFYFFLWGWGDRWESFDQVMKCVAQTLRVSELIILLFLIIRHCNPTIKSSQLYNI
jgi:hypothetical protein